MSGHEKRLLLGLIRSLCRMDIDKNYVDALVYDTLKALGGDHAKLVEQAATTRSFADVVDTILEEQDVKTIEQLVVKH